MVREKDSLILTGADRFAAGTRGQEHLSTLELFRNSDGWQCDMSSPVTQACFMIHVHFEIYHALLCRPSLRVDYQTWMLPTLEFPSNDVSWANRIVWICARILQWADSSQCTSKYWYILKELVDEWEHEQPEGFKKSQYGLSNHTERTSLQNARLQQCHGE